MASNYKRKLKKTEDKELKKKYEENVAKFIADNEETLSKANKMRKDFERTLKFNEKKKRFYRELSNVKVLILTANETERETLFSCFTIYPCCSDIVENNVVVRIPYDELIYSFFYINDIKVVHVEPEMTGSYSKGGTAETLYKTLKKVRPSVVVSLGVGFGYNIDKQSLSDVLVGRQFFSYDKSVKIEDEEISVKKLHIFESDESLLRKVKSTVSFEDKMTGIFDNRFRAHEGNIITGEYVVDSKNFRDLIFAPFKPFGVIGGEMEAFGMFRAIEKFNKKHCMKTRGIMIKGICDWGVGKNANKSKNNDALDEELTTTDIINNKPTTCKIEETETTKHQINEDFKNNLQVLAMCNACTVCKKFLKDENILSDYRVYGHRKRFYRTRKKIRKILLRK